jgi:hypothetical protein
MIPALALACAVAASPAPPPSAAPATLRVQYVHSGTATDERFALRTVAREGPWPGPREGLVDDGGMGVYRVEVRDAAAGTLVFAQGFASIFGEWMTTAEAKTTARGFDESVRFPEPEAPVDVTIARRGADGTYARLWTVRVDPQAQSVDRAAPPANVRVWAVQESGPPSEKVDLLLVGDGYTAAEMDKWHRDARRLAEDLFAVSPFRERRRDFNVWAIDVASDESGVSRLSDGVQRRSAVRATYDAFGSERYVLAFDDTRLREVAAAAPYDFIEIVVNDRKYGGGGIHNLYATVAVDNAFTPYVFVHEFGHHFAGLADEYYTSSTAYEPAKGRPEPPDPNVTADPRSPKWKDLVAADTTLPTPWPKEEFERGQKAYQERRAKIRADKRPESEMEALFREEKERSTRLLGPFTGKVGAYEGAMYEATGYYRPDANCIMFTRDDVGFCAVCRRAIEATIDRHAPRKAAVR